MKPTKDTPTGKHRAAGKTAEETHLDQCLAVLQEHLDEEVDRAVRQADWYKTHSRRIKTRYLSLRVPAIIIAVSLPQLIALQAAYPSITFLPMVASSLAALLAILTALDTFFRYGDTWVEERASELAIYALLRRTKDDRLKIEIAPCPEEGIKVAEKIIASFRNEYERIVGQTVGAFAQRAKAAASTTPSQKSSA